MLRFLSFDINQPSLPTSFYPALGVCFCFCDPFNCVSSRKFSRQLIPFCSEHLNPDASVLQRTLSIVCLCSREHSVSCACVARNSQCCVPVLQMEMLTQKQNGTVGGGEESEEQEQEEKKEHTATIKGLWKKAFKSLKSGGDQKWSVSRERLSQLGTAFAPCGGVPQTQKLSPPTPIHPHPPTPNPPPAVLKCIGIKGFNFYARNNAISHVWRLLPENLRYRFLTSWVIQLHFSKSL